MTRLTPGQVPAELLRPVPRYTSYPTAPHFAAGAGGTVAEELLAGLAAGDDVSVYVHIPYCDRLCWFCGCHTKHTLKYQPVFDYVDSLADEIATVGRKTGGRARIAQLHFGGGSPSMLREPEFRRISHALREIFDIDADTEISVEIDPSDVGEATIGALAAIGITRASIGVQDFDDEVQAAINRPQSFEKTRDVVSALRHAGIGSINIDALYGLPLQTKSRLMDSMEKVLALRPDRIALFGYAHVPWMKKHQNLIREADLPNAVQRFEHARAAGEALCEAGYQAIGIDHFALPDDDLAKASRNGRLHRNFQGYTTDNCSRLIGLGASAIGRSPDGYYQNEVPIGTYRHAVRSGSLAAAKGIRLSADDQARSWLIERLMCDLSIDRDELIEIFGPEANAYFAEAKCLSMQDRFGLTHCDDRRFSVCEDARPFTRVVASWFDAHLETGGFRYSKAV